jgi:Probable Zinc-ribbon domain
MWHPRKNEGWTPQTISVASDVEAWWVCPLGHEWREAVRDRAAARKWKRGNVDACGICLGYHALQSCACGQQRLVKAKPPPSEFECSACYFARIRAQQQYQRLREQARTEYVADFAASQKLLDRIVPAWLPPALAVEWRCTVGQRLRRAMQDELGYGAFGTVGAIDDALRQIRDEGDLLPSADKLRAAHARGEPIRFMDRTFWTQGVLYVLGLDDAPDCRRERADIASLEQWLRANVGRVVNRHHPRETHDTSTLTRVLTDLVEQWGQRDETGPWRSFFELVPPFIPTTGRLCGQFDVVLTRGGSPDLVVEIDSAHHPRSMEKLQFAHAAGATATWIRWNYGTARRVPGVHVIDLIDQTKRITRA